MKTAALYIHIPFCIQRCHYCDFFSQTSSSSFTPYRNNRSFIMHILRDAVLFKQRYGVEAWETVYIGGGTPSLLSPEDVFFLAQNLTKGQSCPVKEFTIEANPEDIKPEWLAACSAGGINRLSIGIQSFNDEVLKKAGRRGSAKKSHAALDTIKKEWKHDFSCDIIAGLSGQVLESLCEDIQQLITYQPEHISLYGLCSETPLPEEKEDEISTFLSTGFAQLEKNGYERYEVSNFSLHDAHHSLHNCMYWNMQSYAGVGPAAFGTRVHEDADGAALFAERFSGVPNLQQWETAQVPLSAYSCETIPRPVLLEEVLIMGFRLTEGINRAAFQRRFGRDILHFIGDTVEQEVKKGRCIVTPERVALTKEGLFFLNGFLVDTLAELDKIRI